MENFDRPLYQKDLSKCISEGLWKNVSMYIVFCIKWR